MRCVALIILLLAGCSSHKIGAAFLYEYGQASDSSILLESKGKNENNNDSSINRP